jgi:hypothetical protein
MDRFPVVLPRLGVAWLACVVVALTAPLSVNAQVEVIRSAPAVSDRTTRYRLTVDAVGPSDREPMANDVRIPSEQRRRGNRASAYIKLISIAADHPTDYRSGLRDQREAWLESPLGDAECRAASRWLASYESLRVGLRQVIENDHCDFGANFYGMPASKLLQVPLPELQGLRELGKFARLESRVALREGRFADALAALRAARQMADDTAGIPLTLPPLLSLAQHLTVAQTLQDWIATPKSENLYWVLAALPRPAIDLHTAADMERLSFELQLREPAEDAAPMPGASKRPVAAEDEAARWLRLIRPFWELERGPSELDAPDGEKVGPSDADEAKRLRQAIMDARALATMYPAAKRQLIAAGWTAERVEQLPVAKVVALCTTQVNREVQQRLLKWPALESPDSWPNLFADSKRLLDSTNAAMGGNFEGTLGISRQLFDIILATRYVEANYARQIAALRIVEALRWHAAEHGGQLPGSLAEIRVAPIPLDPLTGKPFDYAVRDGVGVLELGPHSAPEISQQVSTWEIVIRRP